MAKDARRGTGDAYACAGFGGVGGSEVVPKEVTAMDATADFGLLNTPAPISSNSHDEEGVRVAVGAILERTMLWASCSILLWARYL